MNQNVADIVLIQQISAISTHAVDGLLPAEVLGDCFTPDARMDVLLADGTLIDSAEGHAALFDFCRRVSAADNTRRWAMNTIVEVDGDTAKMRCHGAVVSTEPSARTILRTSVQVSTLVRTAEGWRISGQVLTLDRGVQISSHACSA